VYSTLPALLHLAVLIIIIIINQSINQSSSSFICQEHIQHTTCMKNKQHIAGTKRLKYSTNSRPRNKPTWKRSMGFPTTEKKYCQTATSDFRAQ